MLKNLDTLQIIKNQLYALSNDNNITENTIIFGKESNLDSFDLVNLLIEIEQELFQKYGISITIASDRAMSENHSPFRTVQSLQHFIKLLIDENYNNRN